MGTDNTMPLGRWPIAGEAGQTEAAPTRRGHHAEAQPTNGQVARE